MFWSEKTIELLLPPPKICCRCLLFTTKHHLEIWYSILVYLKQVCFGRRKPLPTWWSFRRRRMQPLLGRRGGEASGFQKIYQEGVLEAEAQNLPLAWVRKPSQSWFEFEFVLPSKCSCVLKDLISVDWSGAPKMTQIYGRKTSVSLAMFDCLMTLLDGWQTK